MNFHAPKAMQTRARLAGLLLAECASCRLCTGSGSFSRIAAPIHAVALPAA